MAQSLSGQINLILKRFGELYLITLKNYAKLSDFYNNKINKDTLSNSDIIKNLKIDTKDEKLIISLFSYYQYIESGRKKGAKGIPISVLIDFIKSKNIKPNNISVNQLAFIFQKSIKEKGIKPRKIFTTSYKVTEQLWEKEFNITLDNIIKDIIFKFNNKS